MKEEVSSLTCLEGPIRIFSPQGLLFCTAPSQGTASLGPSDCLVAVLPNAVHLMGPAVPPHKDTEPVTEPSTSSCWLQRFWSQQVLASHFWERVPSAGARRKWQRCPTASGKLGRALGQPLTLESIPLPSTHSRVGCVRGCCARSQAACGWSRCTSSDQHRLLPGSGHHCIPR